MKKMLTGLFAFALLALSNSVFAVESAIGIDFGEKIHWNEGNPYNAHAVALDFDVHGENFGIRPFFGFSFSKSQASNVNNSAVTYNYTQKSFVETLGIKPYFMFRKAEKSTSYIGLLLALNFHQTSRETTKVTVDGVDSKLNYTAGEFGLFVGNRWLASERLNIFAECDFSSRFFSKTTTYELGGKSVADYQAAMLGGGGTNSWALYVTPKVGISWKL